MMPFCKKCQTMFATRQSLWKHRKRKHPEETDNKVTPIKRKHPDKVVTTNHPYIDEVINGIVNSPSPKKKAIPKTSAQNILIPKKKPDVRKVLTPEVIEEILKPIPVVHQDSSSDSEDEPDLYKDIKPERGSEEKSEEESESDSDEDSDKKLLRVFTDLYSKFDEDDFEIHNYLLVLLDELKKRKCITKDDYKSLKDSLQKTIQLNLYETIESTIENMTRDDKTQILELLRGMKKDEDVKKVRGLVKQYFAGDDLFEDIVASLPTLDDKLEAQRLKVILNQIEKTRNRVQQVFTRLINTTEKSLVLKLLRGEELITAEQLDKLSIAPNSLSSISKIVQGRGLYLSNHR